MKKHALILLALTSSALPAAALSAGQQPGFYLGVETGVALPDDATYSGPGINTDADYSAGGDAGVTLGYRYGNGVRAEFEIDSTFNNIDDFNNGPTVGNLATYDFMVNALYDYANATKFTPYVGIGGGLVRYELQDAGPVGGSLIDDGDTTWGVQGILGASYALNNWMDVFSQYKYVYADDPNVRNNAGTSIDTEQSNNLIQIGLRIDLTPAAFIPDAHAAEGAPQAAPAKDKTYVSSFKKDENTPSYLVFFDFDKSTLTKEAKDIIKKVSAEVKEKKVVRLEVTGHADRAGSEKYNQGLSERRAQAVKQELIKLGVTDAEIATFAKGESQPLVATPDGVKEPQNRRVEVIYTP
jgi:outer membrane protein OmpA-like peptidoglycan-associated protein